MGQSGLLKYCMHGSVKEIFIITTHSEVESMGNYLYFLPHMAVLSLVVLVIASRDPQYRLLLTPVVPHVTEPVCIKYKVQCTENNAQ